MVEKPGWGCAPEIAVTTQRQYKNLCERLRIEKSLSEEDSQAMTEAGEELQRYREER